MNDANISKNQFLTFNLKGETFSVPVSKVKEILEYTPLTRVPRMPTCVAGVINLRGRVVPVTDLRVKLGMEQTERTRHTCIIVIEIPFDGKTTEVGALVDAVQEVIALEDEHVEPPPRLGVGIEHEMIAGMGKRGDRFIVMLNVDHLFLNSEIIKLDFASPNEAA